MPDAPAPAGGGGGGNFLSKKWGPFPVWVYAVAGGALLTLIALYKKGGTAATPTAQASSPYASDSSGILNYPPTVVVTPSAVSNTAGATQPSGASSSTGPGSTAMVSVTDTYRTGNQWLRKGPRIDSPVIGVIPTGTILPAAGGPTGGVFYQNPATGIGSNQWQPVTYAGQTGYFFAPDVLVQGGGAGGGFGARTAARQSDFNRMVPGRQMLLGQFQPSQYVSTAGMGGGDGMGGDGMGMGEGMGGRAMASIARKTGIPVLRLKALNYNLRQPNGAYGPGHVRVA